MPTPMTTASPGSIVAIDPGRAKCGVACISADGDVLYQGVLGVEQLLATLQGLAVGPDCDVILGDGTGHRTVLATLHAAGFAVDVVDERGTSEEARRRCLLDRPAGCLARMVPLGLRCPVGAYDDIVALLLAERRLALREADST